MQFNSKSALQPLLENVDGLVRFKGCYLLKSVEERVLIGSFTTRVAVLSDVENVGELEVRLLGDNFGTLVGLQNEYLQVEVAFKRVKTNSFFYLAWYETLGSTTVEGVGQRIKQLSEKSVLEDTVLLDQRISAMRSPYLRDYCVNLSNVLSDKMSSIAWNSLISNLEHQPEETVCIQLTMLMCKGDVFRCGYFLNLLPDKRPYRAWELSLLGD